MARMLVGGRAGGGYAVGIQPGLLVALDYADGKFVFQRLDGFHQQRRLARAGRGDEVDDENSPPGEEAAIDIGMALVGGHDVLLHLHHAGFAQARSVSVFRPMMMAVIVVMIMFVVMIVGMTAAAANAAHVTIPPAA